MMGISYRCALVWELYKIAMRTVTSDSGLNNADVLLDSGLKLSNIIVILCSKLLDYILLKSGSISESYYILFRE